MAACQLPNAGHISEMAGENLSCHVKNKMAGEILQKQNGVQWLRTQSICSLVSGLPIEIIDIYY